MALYTDHVLPRLINVVCNAKANRKQRVRVCAGLSGEVVEIGFGSGLNIPFYPAQVTGVDAIEPAGVGWKLAAGRVREASVPVRRSGLDGASLPFPDDHFDAALSTWTMCTIPDIDAALRELRRVLKPGGRLHFAEHGLAPDENVRAWQHRLNPLQNRLFGGCNLNRPTVELLQGAGFELVEVDEFYEEATPKVARRAGARRGGVALTPATLARRAAGGRGAYSSSLPCLSTISAAFAGGRTCAGGTVGVSAGTLTSSMKSSKPPGARIQSMRAPSGPTVKRCGMPCGPYACSPAPTSISSSPSWTVIEPSTT